MSGDAIKCGKWQRDRYRAWHVMQVSQAKGQLLPTAAFCPSFSKPTERLGVRLPRLSVHQASMPPFIHLADTTVCVKNTRYTQSNNQGRAIQVHWCHNKHCIALFFSAHGK